MFENCSNSKKKGDAGLGQAIAYFTGLGVSVCVPLTDSQDYDLVVELEHELKKVQVKSAGYKVGDVYRVGLRVCGGNSKVNFVHKHATEIRYDYLFIVTSECVRYLIPKATIADVRAEISLGKKYEKYIV